MTEMCVRVAVRVRPMLPAELLHQHQACVRVLPGAKQVLLGTDKLFNFDQVFGPTATQRDVYCASVKPLVRYVVDGFNATVFCYGQTGSGKSYTLGGRRDTDDEDGGVVDLAVQDLFSLLEEKRSSGDDMQVTVSYIELYMEELRDLLEMPHIHKDLHIREDERGNTVVVGAKEVDVSSVEELLSFVNMGRVLSQTGSTGMNQESSRSHTVLTLHIRPCRHDSNNNSNGFSSKLRLVDLAGSERVARTGNSGTKLKESAHINAGLLALGNVMRALSGRHGNRGSSAHVPYRNAKITRLLRDSLGGTAHTLMVACVSPSNHYVADTLSVLQFASKARDIHNVASATQVPSELRLSPEIWQRREAEVAEMEKELHAPRDKEGGGRVGSKVSHYRVLIQQAADLLVHISHSSPPSVTQALREWKLRVTAVNHTEEEDDDDEDDDDDCDEDSLICEDQANVLQLRKELNKNQNSLHIQHQLLQQKEADLRRLQEEMKKLIQEIKVNREASEEDRALIGRQTEELVNQQVLIDHLQRDLITSGQTQETKDSGYSEKRCHSVSVPLMKINSVKRPIRKIHSSLSERVCTSFRISGHLSEPEVEQKHFVSSPSIKEEVESEHGEEEQEDDDEDDDIFVGRSRFRRSMNLTWTNQQKRRTHDDEDQTVVMMVHPTPRLSTGDTEQQLLQGSMKVQANVTKALIRDLSVNISLKEELLQEINTTDKQTKALDRQSEDMLDTLSLQSEEVSLQQMRAQRNHLQSSLRTLHQENEETGTPQCSWDDRSWLEEEEERVIQKRIELEELQAELRRREEMLQRREICLKEKQLLETKMLRSSQLESVEHQLSSSREMKMMRSGRATVEKEKEELQKQRDTLSDGVGVSEEDKHSLVQLEEAIEALDAAVDLKNQSIRARSRKCGIPPSSLSQLRQTDPAHLCDVIRKLAGLSQAEAFEMLVKYFNKVVCLREQESNLELCCEELQLQVKELDDKLKEMEASMQRLALEADRSLTQQKRHHHGNIQILLQKLRAENQNTTNDKLQPLEKELFFYKSLSRQLKQRLREVLDDSTQSSHTPGSSGSDPHRHIRRPPGKQMREVYVRRRDLTEI
ncbi:kinesin-like protein KIF27 [Gouania willdenowi]|uniref:kinesin-like protein KIF27 n=1 Tax=Gouania willdenowi TaxID=441366 RepID=UPI00105659B6|nr:kinesin-like protein KIF27 [Gouania willdenowi]